MPFALLFIGMILVVTGFRGTWQQLGTLVYNDMVGTGGRAGFIMFMLAIGAVGALGAIRELRTFSHYFLALILISILLSNTGFMQKLLEALKGATVKTPVQPGMGTPQTAGYSALFPGFGTFGAPSSGVVGGFGAPVEKQGGITINFPNVTGVHMTQ